MIERIGPVTARELLEMDDDRWGHLRDRIRREKGKDSLIARCVACEGEVYVRATRRPAAGLVDTGIRV